MGDVIGMRPSKEEFERETNKAFDSALEVIDSIGDTLDGTPLTIVGFVGMLLAADGFANAPEGAVEWMHKTIDEMIKGEG